MIHERQHISNKIHEMLNEITDLNWRDATDLKSELQNIGVRWGVTHPSCNRVDFDTTIKCEKIKQFIFYRCSTCGPSLYMEFEAKRQPNNFVLLGQRLRIRQAFVLWLMNWELSNNLLRFSQTCEFWSSKANWRLRFSLPSIILTDLLGNKTLL